MLGKIKINKYLSSNVKTLLATFALVIGFSFIVACIKINISVTASSIDSSIGPSSSDKIPSLPACTLSEAHLQMKGYKQEQDFWCWGATAKSVIDFLKEGNGPLEEQCQLVDLALGNTGSVTCCGANGGTPDCDVPGLPEDIFDRKNISYYPYFKDPQDEEELFAFITNRICSGKPLIVAGYVRGNPADPLEVYGHSNTLNAFNANGQWVGLCDHREECASDLDSPNRNYHEVSLDSLVNFNPNEVAFIYWTGMR